ncbi:DUF2058 domain-containing protein [Pseudomarimonas salicorniae]|uniref:DUF2058 domain-containing protein n=1 Tax=Pseudomarimonas salicorniae TaxID=2933270 RepID=A0ABT0GJG8_9GAMM|nr:DUF2058 domain-containing protein [Lysobacter sp. CAU 1642]MCK7594177.1 DUF2058 domain-containing protein [Lysobacter sp. CAU 1642]
MRNALQDQLLKAGLAKKSKVDQIAREQAKQRHAKGAPAAQAAADAEIDADRLRREKAERDRALQAERNAQAKQAEQRAQARQIIEQNRLPTEGDSEYRFTDGQVIRSLLITAALRKQLARGGLVIARFDDSYALIPRAAAEKVEARDPSLIVVDHARDAGQAEAGEDDEFYRQFVVPDDLVW